MHIEIQYCVMFSPLDSVRMPHSIYWLWRSQKLQSTRDLKMSPPVLALSDFESVVVDWIFYGPLNYTLSHLYSVKDYRQLESPFQYPAKEERVGKERHLALGSSANRAGLNTFFSKLTKKCPKHKFFLNLVYNLADHIPCLVAVNIVGEKKLGHFLL